MRVGIDGRELQRDRRTGIGRYALEVVTAASRRGWTVTLYGDGGTRRDLGLPGVTVRSLVAPATAWWDQVTLPRALREDRAAVFLSPYYKTPLHLQPALRFLGWEQGSLPESELAAAENFSVPLWPGMDQAIQERVVDVVRSAVGARV